MSGHHRPREVIDAAREQGYDCVLWRVPPSKHAAIRQMPRCEFVRAPREPAEFAPFFVLSGCSLHASQDRCEERVKKNVREFAPGGGYVFNQVHNIQADVPAENVLAMLETAKEAGAYPLCTATC